MTDGATHPFVTSEDDGTMIWRFPKGTEFAVTKHGFVAKHNDHLPVHFTLDPIGAFGLNGGEVDGTLCEVLDEQNSGGRKDA